MTTHLYTDLLSPEEKIKRGKAIKKPPVKGLLPLEKTKVGMMRHNNEVELLRKIQAGNKGKKNVRFNDGTKEGKNKKSVPAAIPPKAAPVEVGNDQFPYDKYITQLVEGMNT